MSRKRTDTGSGFTLVELLVVVSVIVILMGLIVAAGSAFRRTAQREATLANCQRLATAINSYQSDYRAYPTLSPGDPDPLITNGVISYKRDTDVQTLYYDSANKSWSVEGQSVCVLFQLLTPKGKGPYLDAGAKFLRLIRDPDTEELRSIVVDGVTLKVAVDAWDNPIRMSWHGKVWGNDVEHEGPTEVIPRTPEQGENSDYATAYVITTKTGTVTLRDSDDPAYDQVRKWELRGMALWSVGPDGEPDTKDDLDPVIVGR